MKKFIVATLILTLTLLIFPLSSFGEEALVCPREPGQDIEGLVFDFGPNGLPVILPDEEGEGTQTFLFKCVEVRAQGGEHIVLTSSGLYNYDVKLEGDGGILLATDRKVKCKPGKKWKPVLAAEFDSATLNEHFIIEDNEIIDDIMHGGCPAARAFEVPEWATVDLFFKVKEATLFNGQSFDLMLKLDDSEVQIYKLR